MKDAIISNLSKTRCFLIDGYPRELIQGYRFEKEVNDLSIINIRFEIKGLSRKICLREVQENLKYW